jgi:HAMP domain-containing protein
MAEMKRRAVVRLRELSTALEALRRDHAAAEAECRRLQATPPQPTPEPAPPSGAAAARAQEKPVDDSAIDRVQELASRVQGLRAELQEAQALLVAEQTDNRCLRESARELEARLEGLRESSRETESGLLGSLRGRVVSLEAELERSRAESLRLQEAMTRLLGFLDELSGILSVSAEIS